MNVRSSAVNVRVNRRAANALGMALLFVCGLTACSVESGIVGGMYRAQAGSAGTGATAMGVAGSANAGAAQCEPISPSLTISDVIASQSYVTCSGRIAATRFSNALCVCSDAQLGDYLMTRGFDSTLGAYVPGQIDDSGAAVAINGTYSSAVGQTDIGGSFTVAGTNALRFVGQLLVRGDFRASGSVTVAGSATISRNAWLGGPFLGLGPLTVKGELHHAAAVTALPVLADSDKLEAISIPKPCACDESELVDIASLVERARTDNDNSKYGIAEDSLAGVTSARALALPCGRIYLTQIVGSGDVTIDVRGLTALFVESSIELQGNLEFRLAPGAEIDVFVRGQLSPQGSMVLAGQERPSAGRIYVGGQADITLSSPWVGNLYAPRARVLALQAIDVWGSIFAGAFESSGRASFIFDRAVVDAGRSCSAPRPEAGICSTCGWCAGGTACVNGSCGPCRADADCCSQAVCANGSCVPLLVLQ